MSRTVTIYHKPRCSKSRQTLALLEENGVEPKIVEYLKTPPSAAELKRVLKRLGLSPHDIVRGMSAWALGRLGGSRAKMALEALKNKENGIVKEEIEQALLMMA